MRRAGFLLLWIIGALCTPITVLVLLLPIGMAMQFDTTFTIINGSNLDVRVTPLGVVGEHPQRRTLPLGSGLADGYGFLSRRARLSMRPGQKMSLTYDYDDIQFSDLLIESDSGDARVLVIDSEPTRTQYRPPRASIILIPPMARLSLAPPMVLNYESGLRSRILGGVLILLGILGPVFLIFAARNLK